MDKTKVEDALVRIGDLPTLPVVLGRVLDLAFDPESTAADLGAHIALDQSLTARLLKIVNSPYYGFHRSIPDLTSAVVILGFAEVRNIMLTASAFATLPNSASGFNRNRLWAHSIAAALATESCAKRLELETGSCFIAGLLHDMGKVALDILYPQEFVKAMAVALESKRYLREVETECFQLDHAEAGGVLAEHWSFPLDVVKAIQCHHRPQDVQGDSRLTCLTALGDFAADEAGFADGTSGKAAEVPEAAMTQLEMSPEVWQDIVDEMAAASERIESIVGVLGT